jgi:hypothetical protein
MARDPVWRIIFVVFVVYEVVWWILWLVNPQLLWGLVL